MKVPLAYKEREFLRDGAPRSAMTIPWGDVYTAFVSTGIPNIEVYMAMPPAQIAQTKRVRKLGWLLGLKAVQSLLKSQIGKRVQGPDASKRADTTAYVWGEVVHASGQSRALEIETPNGYELTVTAALGIAEHVLAKSPKGGYYTPSQLMGAEYVLSLPGVKRVRG